MPRMLLLGLAISIILSAIVFLYIRYGNIPSDTAMLEAEQAVMEAVTHQAPLPIKPTDTIEPEAVIEEMLDDIEDDIWHDITDGIEQRRYLPNDNPISELIVMRIDPSKYEFRAHYRPAEPLPITEWIERLPNAEIIINANFFDEEYRNLGLLITDGQVHGTPYTERGGWFAIVDGVPHVRSNVEQPYQPDEDNLDQAVQAFPMLVLNSEGTNVTDNGLPSRRTIIGIDSEGRVLIISTPVLGMALSALAEYLPTTDMDIVNAFALDGGRSTMLSFASADLIIPSIEDVPSVLAVYPR